MKNMHAGSMRMGRIWSYEADLIITQKSEKWTTNEKSDHADTPCGCWLKNVEAIEQDWKKIK